MMRGMKRTAIILAAAIVTGAGAGCGSSSSPVANHGTPPSPTTATTPSSTATTSSSPTTSTSAGTGLLTGEAGTAATGDIPDNQMFLTFRNPGGGYSVSYPEGWARKGSATDVSFTDKNNIVHVVIARGPAPTAASVRSELTRLKASNPSLTFTAPHPIQIKAGTAVKSTYTTLSAPNPVTGKRVLLIVDRYEFGRAGKRATVDLGTAKGVDNVDAYRLIINSFRWR
jgi:hypothetical protein